jgi:hypothetical protein
MTHDLRMGTVGCIGSSARSFVFLNPIGFQAPQVSPLPGVVHPLEYDPGNLDG